LFQPCLSLRFGDDRQDFDVLARNVVKDPNLSNTEPVLRPAKSSETLDTASAGLPGFVSQMRFERDSHRSTNIRLQPMEVFDGCRRQNDSEAHSDILAKL
jgi:hypothetical protein